MDPESIFRGRGTVTWASLCVMLLPALSRWLTPPRPADPLVRARLFKGTRYEPALVLAQRVAQVGRLTRRLRRATAALEDALLAVHTADRHD